MTANRRFIFCDIDGTLLHAKGAGRVAFAAAFADAFGVSVDLSHINFAGATDIRVVAQLIHEQKLPSNPTHEQHFFDRLPLFLDEYLADQPPDVLPGVVGFLEHVSPEWSLGLVTGNIKLCAFLKLKHAELDHYFNVGGYGDDHGDRNEIAAFALRRAGNPERSILIGDTPSDIRAAKANGLVSVAVCTGGFSRSALEAEEADFVLDSLADTDSLSQILSL